MSLVNKCLLDEDKKIVNIIVVDDETTYEPPTGFTVCDASNEHAVGGTFDTSGVYTAPTTQENVQLGDDHIARILDGTFYLSDLQLAVADLLGLEVTELFEDGVE